MSIIEASYPHEIDSFLSSNNEVAIVHCYAHWCGPCKFIGPVAENLAKKYGVGLIKVDVDKEDAQTKMAYQIKSMPTFLLIKGKWNNVISRTEGINHTALESMF